MFKRFYKRSKGFMSERFRKIVGRFCDYCWGRSNVDPSLLYLWKCMVASHLVDFMI
jgi:hypothetical protein